MKAGIHPLILTAEPKNDVRNKRPRFDFKELRHEFIKRDI